MRHPKKKREKKKRGLDMTSETCYPLRNGSSFFFDLMGCGGLKSSNRILELVRISFRMESPFSALMISRMLPRTSEANPDSIRRPGSSPPSWINSPISLNGTTFSNITLTKMRPRNSAALGASFTASSNVERTDSNLSIVRGLTNFKFWNMGKPWFAV